MRIGEHYRTLGVAPDCDDVVIRAAFKALLHKFHTGVDNSPQAVAKAARITEAFAVLGSPEKRATYDRNLRLDPVWPPATVVINMKVAPAEDRSIWRQWVDRLKATRPPPLPSRVTRLFRGIATGAATTAGILIVCAAFVAAYDRVGAALQSIDQALDLTKAQPDADAAPQPFVPPKLAAARAGEHADLLRLPIARADDIRSAVSSFKRTERDSLAAAVRYSGRCHRSAMGSEGWRARDYCAAFDFAGLQATGPVSGKQETKAARYFALMATRQAEFYSSLRAKPGAVNERLALLRAEIFALP